MRCPNFKAQGVFIYIVDYLMESQTTPMPVKSTVLQPDAAHNSLREGADSLGLVLAGMTTSHDTLTPKSHVYHA